MRHLFRYSFDFRKASNRGYPGLNLSIRLFVIAWSVLLLAPWNPSAFSIISSDHAYIIFSHIAFAEGADSSVLLSC